MHNTHRLLGKLYLPLFPRKPIYHFWGVAPAGYFTHRCDIPETKDNIPLHHLKQLATRPVAIGAHLEPIFKHAKGTQPQLDTVHFVSDGPNTQHRQKGNFYLMSRIIHRQGFSSSSCNVLEAGHGKGAPGGVGGCLKRAADSIPAKGQDLPTPFDVHTALKTACPGILLCYVPASVIEQHDDLPSTLRPVPRTMALHQLVTTQPCQVVEFSQLLLVRV